MRKDGQITIFLSLILICIFSLLCGLLESARTVGSRYYLKLAANSSVDSVFSQYHKKIWDNYRILLLEYRTREEIEQSFGHYLKLNLETKNWYPMDVKDVFTESVVRITDQQGEALISEILDYMKYSNMDTEMDTENFYKIQRQVNEAKEVQESIHKYYDCTLEVFKIEGIKENVQEICLRQKQHYEKLFISIEEKNGREFNLRYKQITVEWRKLLNEVVKVKECLNQIEKKLKNKKNHEIVQFHNAYSQYVENIRLEIQCVEEWCQNNINILEQAKQTQLDQGNDDYDRWREKSDEKLQEIYLIINLDKDSNHELKCCLQKIKNLFDSQWKELVISKNREITEGWLTPNQLPSRFYRSRESDIEIDFYEKILMNQYIYEFFCDFLEKDSETDIYEIEYLLKGKYSNEENLFGVMEDILFVREAVNLSYILSNPGKMNEAKAIGASIAGNGSSQELVEIMTSFVIQIWSLGEAVIDMNHLLEEKKIPYLKSEDTWNLSQEGLLQIGDMEDISGNKNYEDGITYKNYIKFYLLSMQPELLSYRLMDLMQSNIRQYQKDFLMEYCIYEVDISARICGKHLFFESALLKNNSGSSANHTLTVKTNKAY